jgi:hypothetical protein
MRIEDHMNPYGIVSSGNGTPDAALLQARLIAWHDAMVAHERRLRSGQTTDVCDDECPHVEARTLWAEAMAMLGPRANELTFLRSRALGASASSDRLLEPAKTSPQEAGGMRRSETASAISAPGLSESRVNSSDPSRIATAEV